jgi:SAM-dependent methyltransferase
MDYAKIVKDGYNKIGKRYQDLRLKHSIEEFEKFIKLLPANAHILDAGCGTGIPYAKFLFEKGFKVVGVDFSKEMLKFAKENVPGVEFINRNITKLDFPENSFDALISLNVIIHIPRENHGALFEGFHKILKSDGIMLVTMGICECEEVGEFCSERMFWSHFEPSESLQIIKKCGFDIIDDWFVTTPDWYNEDSEFEEIYYILAKNSK